MDRNYGGGFAELPGFGEMKIKALSAVLAKRIGIETVREIASTFATLGDVDSRDALEHYQALKREWKAKIRAEAS
jgi:acyl carrier protein